jgi:pimeloyl-ACP methyl ester carboxylesterase
MSSNPRNGFFKSSDGTRLFYSIEGAGPPLVFCYGLVCSKLHWSYQMEYLKKNHTVVWMDYRGHNNSQIPLDLNSLTIKDIAHDLECLMDELKLGPATFLGHSMGVNVVLELFHQAPEKVKALVLANGSARDPMETLFGSNVMQHLVPVVRKFQRMTPRITNALWRQQANSKLAHTVIAWGGFRPGLAKEEDISTYIKLFSATDLDVVLRLMEDYENYDALSWLHKVDVPTLIIAGEHDKVIPKEGQELMHQVIAGSHYELIRNGSHCPQMDIPELINAQLERFLREHSL